MNPITNAARRAVGNPASESMRMLRDKKELSNLVRQQSVVDDEQERLSAQPLMAGTLPRSATPDARSYYDNMNRQGRIATLFGSLTGKPVGVKDGGVMGAGGYGGGRESGPTARLASRAFAPDDDFAFKNAQMDIEDRINNREAAAIAALKRLELDPDHDLFSGKAGLRAGEIGDINREQFAADSSARTDADLEDYYAREGQRRDQHYDTVQRQRELLPFNKDYLGAQSRIGVADINRDARLGSAQVAGDARVGSSAINTLGRLATAPAFTPDEVARNQAGTDAVRPLVPGQGGAAPTKPFPRARLAAFAQQNGLSEEQAAQVLESYGYFVQ